MRPWHVALGLQKISSLSALPQYIQRGEIQKGPQVWFLGIFSRSGWCAGNDTLPNVIWTWKFGEMFFRMSSLAPQNLSKFQQKLLKIFQKKIWKNFFQKFSKIWSHKKILSEATKHPKMVYFTSPVHPLRFHQVLELENVKMCKSVLNFMKFLGNLDKWSLEGYFFLFLRSNWKSSQKMG